MKQRNKTLFIPTSLNAHSLRTNESGKVEYQIFPLRALYDIELPEGDWQLLGFHDELTLEQKELCVDKATYEDYPIYMDYNKNAFIPYSKAFGCKESYDTLLESLKIFDHNPFGKEPEKYEDSGPEMRSTTEWKRWYFEGEENINKYAVFVKTS